MSQKIIYLFIFIKRERKGTEKKGRRKEVDLNLLHSATAYSDIMKLELISILIVRNVLIN